MFLERPDITDAFLFWRKLFFRGEIFRLLKKSNNYRLLEGQLNDWNEWQNSLGENFKRKYKISNWDFQYKIAKTLVYLAQETSDCESVDVWKVNEIGKRILDSNFGEIYSYFNLTSWAEDVFRILYNTPRQIVSSTEVKTLLVLNEKKGLVCRLTTELLEKGTGVFFPDSRINPGLEYGQSFYESGKSCWDYFKQSPEFKGKLDKLDVRFRIDFDDFKDGIFPEHFMWKIEGRSATAAFFLCIKKLVDESNILFLENVSFAITADIPKLTESDLTLGPVKEIHIKIKSALSNHIPLIIVSEANKEESEKKLQELKSQDDTLNLEVCKNINDVTNLLSEYVKEKHSFLKSEYENCSKIYWLEKEVDIKSHYQILPVLHTIEKSSFERINYKDIRDNDNQDRLQRDVRGRQWVEESLSSKLITTESDQTINAVFKDCSSITKRLDINNDSINSNVLRFVLLGEPGAGKSTFCRYLAWACGEQVFGKLSDENNEKWELKNRKNIKLIPARVNLSEWETSTKSSLSDYLEERLSCNGRWSNWLKNGEVLLLFDGLDEISFDFIKHEGKLKSELRKYIDCPAIITCRTNSFESYQSFLTEFPIFSIAGLNDSQQNKFVESYSKIISCLDTEKTISQIKRSPLLRNLSTNPQLLSIICLVASLEENKSIPENRSSLYSEAVRKILTPENWKKESLMPNFEVQFDFEEKLNLLENVAYELWTESKDRRLSFSGDTLINKLALSIAKSVLEKQPNLSLCADDYLAIIDSGLKQQGEFRSKTEKLFEEFTSKGGILADSSNRNYCFLHLTFHEFLVASAISKKGNFREIVLDKEKIYDPHWSEILTLLGGLLKKEEAEEYIKNLCEENNRDIFYRPFFLAVAVAVEAISKINPQIVEELFEKSMSLYFDPPYYLDNNFFIPLLHIWGNRAILYLREMLKKHLGNGSEMAHIK